MSLLFRIIYAAHAKGTHHKLALDALKQLTSPDAERWQRVFLKHAETFFAGSKAPDDQFKDFKNHVLMCATDVPGARASLAVVPYYVRPSEAAVVRATSRSSPSARRCR